MVIELQVKKNIGGAWYYFSPAQIKDEFGPDGYYYDKEGKRTDLGTNRYYQLHTHWYYIGKDGKILKGPQTIDGMNVYFDTDGKQVKGHFAADNRFYDKNNGWLVTNRIVNMYGDKPITLMKTAISLLVSKKSMGHCIILNLNKFLINLPKMVVIMMIKVNKLISEQTASST